MLTWNFYSKRKNKKLDEFLKNCSSLEEANQLFESKNLIPPSEQEILNNLPKEQKNEIKKSKAKNTKISSEKTKTNNKKTKTTKRQTKAKKETVSQKSVEKKLEKNNADLSSTKVLEKVDKSFIETSSEANEDISKNSVTKATLDTLEDSKEAPEESKATKKLKSNT